VDWWAGEISQTESAENHNPSFSTSSNIKNTLKYGCVCGDFLWQQEVTFCKWLKEKMERAKAFEPSFLFPAGWPSVGSASTRVSARAHGTPCFFLTTMVMINGECRPPYRRTFHKPGRATTIRQNLPASAETRLKSRS
jgi:hypothetical protein